MYSSLLTVENRCDLAPFTSPSNNISVVRLQWAFNSTSQNPDSSLSNSAFLKYSLALPNSLDAETPFQGFGNQLLLLFLSPVSFLIASAFE